MDLPLLIFAALVAVFTVVQAIRRWSDLYVRMMMLGVTCAMLMIVLLELANEDYLRPLLRLLAGMLAVAGVVLLILAQRYRPRS